MGNSKSRSKQNKKPAQEQDQEQVGEQEDGHKQDQYQDQGGNQDQEQDQDQGENQDQSSEIVDEFTSFIKREINNLTYITSAHHGLLDELVSKNILTSQQASLIEEKDSVTGRTRQLWEELTRESISNETKEEFLNALDKTQHKHVSNYIRGKGERAAKFDDHWPLIKCATEYARMTTFRPNLVTLVDSRNGLLDAMLSADCINDQQKHSAESEMTDEDRNKRLYNIVLRGSLTTYKTFIRCLLETNQHQVVFLLEPNLVGDKRPLNDDQQSRLKRNYFNLVNIMNSKDGLIAELYAAHSITRRQKEYIESASTQSESNQRLIDIVSRGSETNYQKFIECLNKTGQRHVSRILIEDGAVAYMVATINPANNREQLERQIVDQITALMRDTPDEHREKLMDKLVNALSNVRQHINQLRENDATMFQAQVEHSIGLFYFTTSLRGLQYLYDIYSNGQLKSMMQEIFILLLKTDDAVVDLRVDTLRWDLSNYTDCLQQLCTFTNLPILSHVYEMAKQNQQLVAMCEDVRSLPIDQFPFELIEMIVIRAASHLFVTINRRTPRAEVYTLATITAVSHLWWETLSYRKYIKRLLKRSFERVCHPFKCSPQQVTSLHIEGGHDVVGVAVLENELFVACQWFNKIQVFDSRPPFSRQEDIQVEGLDNARDITVCNKSSSLFIADRGTECAIWRVNLLAVKETVKFLAMQWQPCSLSVNNIRLLITPFDGDSLYLYGDDGNELHHIELPRYMDALHAIETIDKTYLVSHRNRFIEDLSLHPPSVSEVDVNGRVVRSFNDHIDFIQFNWPHYMLLDKNHVIIADCFNDRIILLQSNLQLKRILINSFHGEQPCRLCLTSSRLLAVSYLCSTDIDIYQV